MNVNSINQPQVQYLPPEYVKLKHSGLGIASLTIGLINLIFILSLIIRAFILAGITGDVKPDDPFIIAAGFGFLGGCAVFFWGIIFSIAGRCNPDLNKMFSILGLALNIALLLVLIGLVILGLLWGQLFV